MKTKVQHKTIVLAHVLKADANGNLPKTIEIAKTGFWRTPWHGTFELTANDFVEAEAHFNDGVYRVGGTEPLAGTLDHLGGESRAAFRMTRVYAEGDRLLTDVTWTQTGVEALERDDYRYVSFEYCTRAQPFIDPEDEDNVLVNVVTGATLTNDPLFKKLKPVMASARSGVNNEGEEMNLKDILAKKPEDLSDDEKTFLEEHKDELTDEQRQAFGIEAEETDEEKETREAKEAADKKAADEAAAKKAADDAKAKEEADKLEASTKGMSAEAKKEFLQLKASVAKLEAEAQAGREAKKELLKSQLTASIEKHVARGAVKSDQINAGVELLMASSEGDRKKLLSFIEALPNNELLADARGKGGEEEQPVELTPEETALANAFGNTPEEIAEYKKEQEAKA
jgi:hypothetical protein